MPRVHVRLAKIEDAEEILKVHYSAVHKLSSNYYSSEVTSEWSKPVTPERIQDYLKHSFPHETTLVAEIEGKIVGFGAIVEAKNELRALYVAAEFSREGVGTALLIELEKIALERGCSELLMDSSLTAENFYKKHNYEEIKRAQHTLSSGTQMPCIKMRKLLSVKPQLNLLTQNSKNPYSIWSKRAAITIGLAVGISAVYLSNQNKK